tara:strand:- start:472 stop:1188 length:717 start_codon:yes stop_codon:yes gene_type:complete
MANLVIAKIIYYLDRDLSIDELKKYVDRYCEKTTTVVAKLNALNKIYTRICNTCKIWYDYSLVHNCIVCKISFCNSCDSNKLFSIREKKRQTSIKYYICKSCKFDYNADSCQNCGSLCYSNENLDSNINSLFIRKNCSSSKCKNTFCNNCEINCYFCKSEFCEKCILEPNITINKINKIHCCIDCKKTNTKKCDMCTRIIGSEKFNHDTLKSTCNQCIKKLRTTKKIQNKFGKLLEKL